MNRTSTRKQHNLNKEKKMGGEQDTKINLADKCTTLIIDIFSDTKEWPL